MSVQNRGAQAGHAGAVAAWFAGLVLGCGVPARDTADRDAEARPTEKATLTVFAAASLTEPFQAIAAAMKAGGASVRFNFAGSHQLASQIEHGADADVFAPADEHWMAYLETRGRIGGSGTFARNRLCVVVPRSNPARIERLDHLARPGVKLVIAAEAVPVGRYARALLHQLAAAPGSPADFASRALANVVSEEEHVKAIVAKVRLGEADAGIVYRSDVSPTIAPHVRVFEIPAGVDVEATYPIAIVRGTDHMAEAREFLAFVFSPEGQRILEAHGFLPARSAAP